MVVRVGFPFARVVTVSTACSDRCFASSARPFAFSSIVASLDANGFSENDALPISVPLAACCVTRADASELPETVSTSSALTGNGFWFTRSVGMPPEPVSVIVLGPSTDAGW